MPENWTGYGPITRQSRIQRIFAALGECPECEALPGNPCRELSYKGHWQQRFKPHAARREAGGPDA